MSAVSLAEYGYFGEVGTMGREIRDSPVNIDVLIRLILVISSVPGCVPVQSCC
jgi:hypothetical protein